MVYTRYIAFARLQARDKFNEAVMGKFKYTEKEKADRHWCPYEQARCEP